MVAPCADASGLHAELVRDGLHGQSGMAEQRQVGFHAVGVSPEDADHLVADFGGVDGGENGGAAQQVGYLVRAGFAAQVGDHRVGVGRSPGLVLPAVIAGCLGGPVRGSGSVGGRSGRRVGAAERPDRVVWDRSDDRVITAVDDEHGRGSPPVPHGSRTETWPLRLTFT